MRAGRLAPFLASRWGVLAGGSALALYLLWNAWWLGHGQLPPSMALGLFGFPAPTTGFTRAFIALCRGEIALSLWWNPMLLPLVFLTLHGLARLARRGFLERGWVWAWGVVLWAGWVWKIAQGPAAW